ncbi:MAG: hypothetical protein ACOYEF_15380, partial [Planifilum sp.]
MKVYLCSSTQADLLLLCISLFSFQGTSIGLATGKTSYHIRLPGCKRQCFPTPPLPTYRFANISATRINIITSNPTLQQENSYRQPRQKNLRQPPQTSY